MSLQRRHWSWHVSAVLYRLSYINIAHQLDEDLFAYLDNSLAGSIIADCGCGPGIVTEKFLQHGAARVYAIDGNAAMLRQVRERLPVETASGKVVTIHSRFDASLFSRLQANGRKESGLDAILFKRSLYGPPEQALKVLQTATAALEPGGVLAVIHAEKSLLHYAFGPGLRPAPYTAYHLFNRFASLLGDWLGIGEYHLYTPQELLALLEAAAPGWKAVHIPSRQQAYILAAIHRPILDRS